MIRIVLCEGETDQILLGLYLGRVCGWAYETKPKTRIKLPNTASSKNKKVETYSKGQEELHICCVGGKDGFGQFFQEYILRIIQAAQYRETDFRIALVTDADDRSIADIEANISHQLSPHISSIQNNMWQHNSILTSFDSDYANVDFLLTVIPREGSGALENVLMDSLAEKNTGNAIVAASESFVDELPENEYIPTERLKLKAKLGVALSVFYPDKVFSQFDQQLQIVDWSQSTTLSSCFSELLKI